MEVKNPTGGDLLLWLAGKLKTHATFDADLPRFSGPAARFEFQAAMRRTLARAFHMPDLMERYCNRMNERALVRRAPAEARSEAESLGRSIAWSAPRRPRIWRRNRETIYVRVADTAIDFPADAAPLLQFLIDRAPAPVDDFYAEFEGEFDRGEIADFLAALSRAGVIILTGPEGVW
jgi:hypothetical protein